MTADQSQDALPFVVCPETVALIDSRKYYSRDRANERDRLDRCNRGVAEALRLLDTPTPPAEVQALLDAEFSRRARGY